MTQLPRDAIGAALEKKGFTLDNQRDHFFYFLTVDGKRTGIYTKLSRGGKYREVQAPLIAAMAQQMGLTKAEFTKLVECEIDGARLLAMLRERKKI